MIDSKRATHSPVTALSSQRKYRLRSPSGASSAAAIRSPGPHVCCRIALDAVFWSAPRRPPRWPRLNEVSSDSAPLTLTEPSTLSARMRRSRRYQCTFGRKLRANGWQHKDSDLEQGVNNVRAGGNVIDSHRRDAATIFPHHSSTVVDDSQMRR